jgi:hypothetical protein
MIDAKQVWEELARAINCMRQEGLENEELDLKSWTRCEASYNSLVINTLLRVGTERHRFLIQIIDLGENE